MMQFDDNFCIEMENICDKGKINLSVFETKLLCFVLAVIVEKCSFFNEILWQVNQVLVLCKSSSEHSRLIDDQFSRAIQIFTPTCQNHVPPAAARRTIRTQQANVFMAARGAALLSSFDKR
jgi:hypothetical protein